ncbi:MAG: hypothetical protein ACRCTY_02960 [Candidatus Adiutrix sp.]
MFKKFMFALMVLTFLACAQIKLSQALASDTANGGGPAGALGQNGDLVIENHVETISNNSEIKQSEKTSARNKPRLSRSDELRLEQEIRAQKQKEKLEKAELEKAEAAKIAAEAALEGAPALPQIHGKEPLATKPSVFYFDLFNIELPPHFKLEARKKTAASVSDNLTITSNDKKHTIMISVGPPAQGTATSEVEQLVRMYGPYVSKSTKSTVGNGGYRLETASGDTIIYYCALGQDVLAIQVVGDETAEIRKILSSIKK